MLTKDQTDVLGGFLVLMFIILIVFISIFFLLSSKNEVLALENHYLRQKKKKRNINSTNIQRDDDDDSNNIPIQTKETTKDTVDKSWLYIFFFWIAMLIFFSLISNGEKESSQMSVSKCSYKIPVGRPIY